MNPHNNLIDFIHVFENVVPEDLCDRIVNEYKDEDWQQTLVGLNQLNLKVRDVMALSMSHESVININPEVRKQLDHEMFTHVGGILNQYKAIYPEVLALTDSGYELLKYGPGQFYSTHIDSMVTAPREVSCSISLNDNFEGGEFSFWDRQHKVRAKKGSAILFPSTFMYPHEILPVTSGTRYSIVTWFI